MKRVCVAIVLLVAPLGRAEDTPKTADARYFGVVLVTPGKGSLSEFNPWSHLYACFDVGGEMVIGEWFSWRWDDTFRRVKYRSMVKARYDSKHVWVTLPTGKEVRLKRDLSNPGIVEDCKRQIAQFSN